MTYERLPVGAYQANCCLVYDESGRAVVIDPGDEAARLLAKIRENGLQVEAILLTHAHFDHIGAVQALQHETGAPLYVHEAEQKALTNPVYSMVTEPLSFVADHVLRDNDTVTVESMTLTVLHTPGHTEGSVCYLCENTLFAGDTLFAGSVGRTDFAGGSFTALRESLVRLSALPDQVVVVPGHGAETTIGAEKRSNPFMTGL